MSTFPDMSERHGYGLMRLAEMAGKLVEQAYHRAIVAETSPEKDQAALVFDRLARGFRLTLMLEARMAREQRRDVREIERFDAEVVTECQDPSAIAAPRAETRPQPTTPCAQEADRESESDHETSGTSPAILTRELSSLLDEQADQLDPDGSHRATLADIASWWAKSQHDAPPSDPAGHPPAARPQSDDSACAQSGPPDPSRRPIPPGAAQAEPGTDLARRTMTATIPTQPPPRGPGTPTYVH